MTTSVQSQPEVWLRGPIHGVSSILMPAAHALLQAGEEARRAAESLTLEELHARPGGVASPAFHLRHMAGVIDRMLTYAHGGTLSAAQFEALRREGLADETDDADALLESLDSAIDAAMSAYRTTPVNDLFDTRDVGRARLPSTVFGLLFHAAEHAQRHAGQLTTTVAVIRGMRG